MTECRPVVWLGSCLLALTPACIAAAVDSIDARSSVPLTDSTFGQVFASRLEGAEARDRLPPRIPDAPPTQRAPCVQLSGVSVTA